MGSLTVRITKSSHDALRQLADDSGRSMQDVLEEAVEALRRERFFAEMNAGYTKLKSNPKAWEQELKERAAWDSTLKDGLAGE